MTLLDVIDLDEILTWILWDENFLSYGRQWARAWFENYGKIKIKKKNFNKKK